MDVDESTAPAPSAPSEALVSALSTVLEQVASEPNNTALLRRQVDLMLQVDMVDEAADTASTVSTTTFLGEALWKRVIAAKIGALEQPVKLDALADLLELFGAAEGEYLSPDILEQHARFLIGLVSPTEGEEGADANPAPRGDDEVHAYLNPETLRGMLRELAERTNGVWTAWIDWEVSLLQGLSGAEKREQIQQIGNVYLARLATPHTGIGETSSAYSSFCSTYAPDEYEDRLVQATRVSQDAKWKLEKEKRYGKTRADFEEQLAAASDVTQQATVLLAYVDWETDGSAKRNKKGKGPQQDVGLCRVAFERLLRVYGSAASTAEEASFAAEGVAEMEKQMRDTALAYKAAEAATWTRYFDWLVDNTKPTEEENLAAEVAGRAVRAVPSSGEAWNRYLTTLEEGNDIPGIDKEFEKAKGLIVGCKAAVNELVEVLVTHSAILLRRYRELEVNAEHPVFLALVDAFDFLMKSYPEGDSSLRLEKFAISWAESTVELIHDIIALLSPENPAPSRSGYQFTILAADAQARYGDVEGARERYTKAVTKPLDWPEAVFEAFATFENVHGSLETITAARKVISTAQRKLNRRREREAQQQAEAQAAYAQQAQAYAQQEAAAQPAAAAEPVAATVETAVAAAEGGDAMAVDSVPAVEAAPVPAPTATPAAPVAAPAEHEVPEIKRDRENTTVLVTGLGPDTTIARVQAFFEESGKVRECSMAEEAGAAMVEFEGADSVPVALARDGKKLDGQAIRVSMLWRCTLFVTNFPRSADNDSLKALFGQYGKILSIRWPSRKYVDSRRFCYITMESPAAAQEALVLHKFQPAGENFPMSVLVSDPSIRSKRTDFSNCTLFIGGLHPKSTEGEVRHLLESYGTIVSIKLPWDRQKNQAKGIAFVEMQNKAQAEAALKADGTSYRGKHLKVTLSDPHHGEKNRGKIADASAAAVRRACTVYLFDLPPSTQEGLLQQALEKEYAVKRVEVFSKTSSARVELASQKDAGSFLIRPEPFVFNGTPLRVQDGPDAKVVHAKPAAAMAASTSKKNEATPSALAFAPRPRKAGKAMGQAYRPPRAAAATAAHMAKPATEGKGEGTEKKATGQDAFRAFMNDTNEARKKASDERHERNEREKAERLRLAAEKREERERERAKDAEKDGEAKDGEEDKGTPKKRALDEPEAEESGAKRAKRDEE